MTTEKIGAPAARLTNSQRSLLMALPDAPSDGRMCRGSHHTVANNLVRLGFAREVGAGSFNGAYFVRTPEGKAALESTHG